MNIQQSNIKIIMDKKAYIRPVSIVMEIETASMIASSPGGLNDNNGEVTGDFGDGTTLETADAVAARISSQRYFDAWDTDDTDEGY